MPLPLRLSTLLFALLAAALLVPVSAEAQVWNRIKKKAQEKVEQRAEDKAGAAVEAALDGFENAVACAVTDQPCIDAAQNNGQTVVMTDAEGAVIRDADGAPITDPATAQAQAAGETVPLKPGEGVWANYDFVPGDRVLFADDFADEYVGDFPRRLTYLRGNLEVVEWEGRRLLRGTGGDRFIIQIPDGLPEQYTVEFDIHDPTTSAGTDLYPAALENGETYAAAHRINIGSWRGSGVWGRDPVSTNAIERLEEEVIPIRISVDRGYVKVYAHERRIANVPQVDFPEGETGLTFHLHSRTDRPIYLGDLRVAEGGRTRIYETLSAEGRFVTRGILFDTGQANLRPESTPTLKEIVRMMGTHSGLRLRVEGHTDNVGTPESNLLLSQRRAQAVVDHLVAQGIDAGRLEAVGRGDAQPAADNATPEGRQTNRRVELVTL
jgi:outer membrane protein OmpA-like peptidoglycan-associated protein